MSTAEKLTTAEELLRLPRGEFRYELIEGELLMMTPAGSEHGAIGMDLGMFLAQYVRKHALGRVFCAETGFKISQNPDTVLAPDVAFVCQSRLEEIGLPKSFFPEAPALAVEVASPGDTIEEVDTKIRRWLTAGTQLAWVVNPSGRTVTIYRALDDIQVLTEKDTLTGDSVVPGFECKVAELFAGLS
ncbi:MAG: Uma2 family endonuclease [Planctomycetes bacterium]|nr:Uma2 family endonuclease [Planctomycetota bacterium]